MRKAVAGSAVKPDRAPRGGKTGRKIIQQRYLLLMLLPSVIAVALLVYKPVSYWVIAFTDYKLGFDIFGNEWNNFASFKEFFVDSMEAGRIFTNTLVINVASLFINLISAMVFAILLSEIRWKTGKSLVQTFTLFPFFISWVMTYALFSAFLSANTGMLTALLERWGLISPGFNVLGDPNYAWGLMIFSNLWKSLGYNSVIFLATIAGIDQEQYEAAEIDGAGRFAKIRYITIPSLSLTLGVLLVINSGWVFNSNFDQFYQFTNPTNLPRMEVFDMFVYRLGIRLGRLPYATAVGVCKTGMSLLLLWLTNKIYRKLAGQSIF